MRVAASRLEWIDGLRAVLALYVAISHCFFRAFPYENNGFVPDIVNTWAWPFMFGKAAVAVFLVLSGFCICRPLAARQFQLNGTAAEFFLRRARRILPAYYIALALSVILVWFASPSSPGFSLMDVVAHAGLVHNFYNRIAINTPMWSIAIEWQIYFLVPLMLLSWRKLDLWALVLWLVICSSAFLWLDRHGWGSYTWIYPALFMFGMYAAAIYEKTTFDVGRIAGWRILLVATTSMLVLGCVFLGPLGMQGLGFGRQLTHVVVLTILGCWSISVIMVAGGKGKLATLLSLNPMPRIGLFSYSLYLIHDPILVLLKSFFPLPITAFWVLLLVGIPLSMVVAYVLARCFEFQSYGPSPKRRRQVIDVL